MQKFKYRLGQPGFFKSLRLCVLLHGFLKAFVFGSICGGKGDIVGSLIIMNQQYLLCHHKFFPLDHRTTAKVATSFVVVQIVALFVPSRCQIDNLVPPL